MRRRYGIAGTVTASGLAISLGAAPAGHAGLLKCGIVPPEGPVIAVDGVVRGHVKDGGTTEVWSALGIERDDIVILEVVCMDPVDSTFSRAPGVPVVSYWTRRGPVPQIRPALAALVEAQDQHRALRGRWAAVLDELPLPTPHGAIQLDLTTEADGWVATARVPRLLHTCFVFDGEAAAPASGLAPRDPDCRSDEDLAQIGH